MNSRKLREGITARMINHDIIDYGIMLELTRKRIMYDPDIKEIAESATQAIKEFKRERDQMWLQALHESRMTSDMINNVLMKFIEIRER